MAPLDTLVGLAAAVLTSASYVPQVRKCWRTRQTEDLSLRMLLILSGGIGLWVVYGLLRGDAVIVLANGVSLMLLGNLLYFKLAERTRSGRTRAGRTRPGRTRAGRTRAGRAAGDDVSRETPS